MGLGGQSVTGRRRVVKVKTGGLPRSFCGDGGIGEGSVGFEGGAEQLLCAFSLRLLPARVVCQVSLVV